MPGPTTAAAGPSSAAAPACRIPSRRHMRPACKRASPGLPLTLARAFEQLVARDERGLVDVRVEQRLERPAQNRPFSEPELDQIRSVHVEIGQVVRLAPLLLQEFAQPRSGRELILRDLLAAEVSL